MDYNKLNKSIKHSQQGRREYDMKKFEFENLSGRSVTFNFEDCIDENKKPIELNY